MKTLDQPLNLTNPEAARNLTLATKYLMAQDLNRAIHYSRQPAVVGAGMGVINLLTALSLSRRYEGVVEMAAAFLVNQMHSTVRSGILDVLLPSLCFLGSREGDCSEAYAVAHELASQASINPDRPLWQGQSLRGKSLLVSLSGDGFGGSGDYIMFARFVPYVASLGPRITIQCSPALARLFATLPGVVGTCGYEDRPLCDYAVSILQLPHILGMSGVPLENPFSVSPVPFPQERHNVAVNWGASWTAPYLDRACALSELMPLMALPSTSLYAVQKGPHQRQLYPPPMGFQAHDLAPKFNDFLDTAIVLSSMDAVVTTDNVVANLACMLGCPTFVLVPKAADWRWGEGGRAPWYPSARVYHQTVSGEWGDPINRLAGDLARYLRDQARLLPEPAQAEEVAP